MHNPDGLHCDNCGELLYPGKDHFCPPPGYGGDPNPAGQCDRAADILTRARELITQNRARQNGPKAQNHANIAKLWTSYLAIRRDPKAPLSGADVAHMMALFKIVRTQLGARNADDWIDGCGYLAIAGEISE